MRRLRDVIHLAAHAVDGVLLVVKAGETNRRALVQVRKRLDRVGGRLVGAVLNFVHDLHPDGYIYGAYYHAYYGTKGKHDYLGQTHSVGQEDEGRGEA